MVLTLLRACAFISDPRHFKEDEKYNQFEKALLANPRLLSVVFRQNKVHTADHFVDSFRVSLVATRKITVLEELYVNYRRPEVASSVQLEYV